MKIYIWHYLLKVTGNEHDAGAVVIITDRDYEDVWTEYRGQQTYLVRMLGKPDLSYVVDEDNEQIYVYEDAGCC